jgi:ABC-type nitrate/sulfonate/bicarbonate transport system permease component
VLTAFALILAEIGVRTVGVGSDMLASPTAATAELWSATLNGSLLLWTSQTLGAAIAGLSIDAGLGLVTAAVSVYRQRWPGCCGCRSNCYVPFPPSSNCPSRC